jgi:hypothetical protein
MGLDGIVAIGWRAAALLSRPHPVARVLAPLSASIYIGVDGEILWLGGPADVMHPRAVLLSEPPDPAGLTADDAISLPPCGVSAWRPEALVEGADVAAALRRGAARLAQTALELGEPQGFGARLADRVLQFPLAGAGRFADTLAEASAADDASAAAEAALALLGLGTGLTPSGDDFVGGAFFARATLGRLGGSDSASWGQAAAGVRAAARGATHPISAALLGDLVDGHGWSPLHDLTRALAAGDDAAATNAAQRLVRLGHSSGWDLLAGFVAGCAR